MNEAKGLQSITAVRYYYCGEAKKLQLALIAGKQMVDEEQQAALVIC